MTPILRAPNPPNEIVVSPEHIHTRLQAFDHLVESKRKSDESLQERVNRQLVAFNARNAYCAIFALSCALNVPTLGSDHFGWRVGNVGNSVFLLDRPKLGAGTECLFD